MRQPLIRPVICLALMGTPTALSQQAPEPQTRPAEAQPTELSLDELIRRGEALLAADRLEEAYAYVQAALRRDPQFLPALLLDADLAWKRNDLEHARERWLEVLRIQRGEFRANFGLGRYHARHQSWRSAMFYLEAALKVAPADRRSDVLIELARAYRGVGERARAREAARQAVELAPESLDPRSVYVALLIESGELDEAVVQAEKLVDLAVRLAKQQHYSIESLRQLSSAYNNQIQALRVQYQQLNERNPDGSYTDRILPGKQRQAAEVLSRLIDVYAAQQELQRVLTAYDMVTLFGKRMVELDPGNPDTWLKLARIQRQAFQFADAAASFQKVLELRPGDEAARAGLIETLEKLLELDPGNEAARQQLENLRARP